MRKDRIKILEQVDIKFINQYIATLKKKGFKGNIILWNEKIADYHDFNEYYKSIYQWYSALIGLLDKSEERTSEFLITLYPIAFKYLQIERRSFGLKLEDLMDYLFSFGELLKKDLNCLRLVEKELREGLDTYFQNREKLGYEVTPTIKKGSLKVKTVLNLIKGYLENYYSVSEIAKFKEDDNLVFYNRYLKITYKLGDLDKQLSKRLDELVKDYNALP